MRTRIEAARYVEDLLNDVWKVKPETKKTAWGFGKVELHALFDFIWEGEPAEHSECIYCRDLRNNTAAKNKRFG